MMVVDSKAAIVDARRGVRRLFVGGLVTAYHVRQSTLDALREGFEVVVLEDAVRAVAVTPGNVERARDAIAGAGGHRARPATVHST